MRSVAQERHVQMRTQRVVLDGPHQAKNAKDAEKDNKTKKGNKKKKNWKDELKNASEDVFYAEINLLGKCLLLNR